MIKKLARRLGFYSGDEPQTNVVPFQRFAARELFSDYQHRETSIDPTLFPGKKKFLLTDSEIENAQLLELCRKIKSIDEIPVAEIAGSIFYVYFQSDSDALYHLRKIIEHGGTFFPPLLFGKTQYRFTNRHALETLRKTWANAGMLSHLDVNVHENICEALELTREVEGDFVEIGVYLGGSAFTALNYLDAIGVQRRCWLMDTFDGFNYEHALASADGIWKKTHQLDGPQATMDSLRKKLSGTKQNFQLVRSNICESPLPAEIKKIAVANVDVDMYEATKIALAKVAPLVANGGIIICEDAASTPGLYGALVAMNDFLQRTDEGRRFVPVFKGGQYFLLKLR